MPTIKIKKVVEQEVETEVTDAQYIGHKICYYRKRKKLKQYEVAKLINLTDVGYYCQIESGKKNITLKKLKQVCEVLDVTSSKILPF